MKLQTQSMGHLQNRCKTGVALARQSLVQTFAPKPCVLGQLRHAFGPYDVAKSFGDEGGIITRLLQTSF